MLGRYIQLPINAAMREAWQPSWQSVRAPGASADEPASLKLAVTEAAAQLGLGVFASGPLGEGSLLSDRQLLVRADGLPWWRTCRLVLSSTRTCIRAWLMHSLLHCRQLCYTSHGSPGQKSGCFVQDATQILPQMQDRLGEFPQLRHIRGDGAKLLQLARSTPYVICAVVGQKTPSNVDQNLALTQVSV